MATGGQDFGANVCPEVGIDQITEFALVDEFFGIPVGMGYGFDEAVLVVTPDGFVEVGIAWAELVDRTVGE